MALAGLLTITHPANLKRPHSSCSASLAAFGLCRPVLIDFTGLGKPQRRIPAQRRGSRCDQRDAPRVHGLSRTLELRKISKSDEISERVSGADCDEGVLDCAVSLVSLVAFLAPFCDLRFMRENLCISKVLPYHRDRRDRSQESLDANEVETDASGGHCATGRVVLR